MSSLSLKLFGEKRFLNSVKVLPVSIKSINSIQKYPHITQSHACFNFLLLIKALISFGICSTPKPSK